MAYSSAESTEQAPRPPQAHDFESNIPDEIAFEAVNSNMVAIIDTLRPLADEGTFQVAAELEIGNDSYLILDLRNSPGAGAYSCPFEDGNGPLIHKDAEFLIISQDFEPTKQGMRRGLGFKSIRKGEPVTLGRDHHENRFDYSNITSRDHTEISYDEAGNLTVRDLGSTNGTKIKAPGIDQVTPREYRRMGSSDHATRGDRARGNNNNPYENARRDQEEAVRNMRAREDDAMRKQQEQRRQERAERSAVQARADQKAKHKWQNEVAQRQSEISRLERPVREVLQRKNEHDSPAINIPPELPVDSAANIIRGVMHARVEDKSDKQIFVKLAKDFHPDGKVSAKDKTQRELRFKMLGEIYDSKKNEFRF